MIGVFDSGLGGLTVLKAFITDTELLEYDYIYLGDNARAPYGSKSSDTVYDYTVQAVDFLFKKGCVLAIIACNTASAEALRRIQQTWLRENFPDRRILGVVIPIAEEAASCGEGKIGVIGTRATINSKVYEREMAKIDGSRKIIAQACPLLVPLVEEGWIDEQETMSILEKYLSPIRNEVKTLILGCTHYPFLLDKIKIVMGSQVRILNSPEIVASKLRDYLNRHPEIRTRLRKDERRHYFTSDSPERFKELGERFLQMKMGEVNKAEL